MFDAYAREGVEAWDSTVMAIAISDSRKWPDQVSVAGDGVGKIFLNTLLVKRKERLANRLCERPVSSEMCGRWHKAWYLQRGFETSVEE